ncbi:hypothetical protein L596_002769 [Steinernema carpocapsae]|uniref:VWFA domain-containing protein n=1 Tax=Steinernema carpocapsae TaxID=34508 RepID=A0A4U8US17_STECR|nr:hypothetical protein L596_002769 [Steinernema carpocapsae]
MLGTQIAVMGCICCKSCNCCCVPSKKRLKAIEGGDAYSIPGIEHIPRKVKASPEKDVLHANRKTRKELEEWEAHRRSVILTETGWLFRSSKSEAALQKIEAGNRDPVHLQVVLLSARRADATLRRCESEQPKVLKSCLITGQSSRWGSIQDESGFFAEVIPLEGTTSKGGFKNMKKGFKQFFAQERPTREYESEQELSTPQQGRRGSGGFFQKLFRGNGRPDTSPITLSPLGSPMSGRRKDWESEDDYAEILNARAKSNERDINVYPGTFASNKKRESSLRAWCLRENPDRASRPVAHTVVLHIEKKGLECSRIPQECDIRRRDIEVWTSRKRGTVPERRQMEVRNVHIRLWKSWKAIVRNGRLDEATLDLLRLSTEPAAVTFSGSPRRSQMADKLPKAASTSSLHKVIRTENGGLLKVANVFTWDPERLSSRLTDEPEYRKVTENGDVIEVVQRIEGKPVVRTTVEGKMRMEKVVGAKLKTIDELIGAGWTIRDTVINYKIKTTMGNRQMVVEEERVGSVEDFDSQYRMQMYKDGKETSAHVANIDIPPGASKSEYLSKLSEKLMREMAAFEGEQETAKTRVEVEVVENVTNLMKTYIIGQRDDTDEIDEVVTKEVPQLTEKEFNVETASDTAASPPPIERVNKEYIDQMEKELQQELAKKDIHLTTPGKQFEGADRIIQHKRFESDTESVDSFIAKRSYPRCSNVFADCDMVRTEDSSSNQVFIAIPNEIAFEFILRTERLPPKPKGVEPASYGLEKSGKHYEESTIMKRTTRFESTASEETFEEEPIQPLMEKPLAEPEPKPEPEREPPKGVEEQLVQKKVEELRVEERHEELRETEPYGGDYSMQQKGQRYEGDVVIRKKVHKFVSEESEEEREKKIQEPQGGQFGLAQAGQHYEDRAVLKRSRRFESEDSEEKEPTEVNLVKDESNGIFTVSIECSNTENFQFITREKRSQKFETASMQMSIRKATEESDVRERVFGESHKQSISQQITATAEENIFLSDGLQRVTTISNDLSASKTLKDATVWREAFSGLELSEETATIMIALQNQVSAMLLRQSSEYNWANKQREATKSRVREMTEENAMTMYSFASHDGRCLSVESLLKDQVLLKHSFRLDAAQTESASTSVSLSCPNLALSADFKAKTANTVQTSKELNEFLLEQTSAMVYLKNAIESVDERTHKTLAEPRVNSGNYLDAYSQTNQNLSVSIDLSREANFLTHLESSASWTTARNEKLSFTSSASSTEIQTANYSLSCGGKAATATLKIASANEGIPQLYDIVEVGNEMQNCAVMMTCGGVNGQHASTSWAESVSARETRHSKPSVTTKTIINREEVDESENVHETHITEINEKIVHRGRSKSIEYRDMINREEFWDDESISESYLKEDLYRKRMARSMTDVSTYTTDMEDIDVVDSTVKIRRQDSTHTTTILVHEPFGGQTSSHETFRPSRYRQIYERVEETLKTEDRKDKPWVAVSHERETEVTSRFERRTETRPRTQFVKSSLPQATSFQQFHVTRAAGDEENKVVSEIEKERVQESSSTSSVPQMVQRSEELTAQESKLATAEFSAALSGQRIEHKVETIHKDVRKDQSTKTTAPSTEETLTLVGDYFVVDSESVPATIAIKPLQSHAITTKAATKEVSEVSSDLLRLTSDDVESRLSERPSTSAERGFAIQRTESDYDMTKSSASELPVRKSFPLTTEEREVSTVMEFSHQESEVLTRVERLARPRNFEEAEMAFADHRRLEESLTASAMGDEISAREQSFMKPEEADAAELRNRLALTQDAALKTASAKEALQENDVNLFKTAKTGMTTVSVRERSSERLERRLKESSDEDKNVYLLTETCERDQFTKTEIPVNARDLARLNARESEFHDVSVKEELRRSASGEATRIAHEPVLEEGARQFKIAQETFSMSFQRPDKPRKVSSVLRDASSTEHSTTVREYITEGVSCIATSQRVLRPVTFAVVDTELPLSRSLREEISTPASALEEVHKTEDLSYADMSASSQLIRRIPNFEESNTSTSAAKHEERRAHEVFAALEQSDSTATVFQERPKESGEKSAREMSEDQTSLFANVKTVSSNLISSETVKVSSFAKDALSTKTVGDVSSDLQEHLERDQEALQVAGLQHIRDEARDSRKFEIAKEEVVMELERPHLTRFEETRVSETVQESFVGRGFLEYGNDEVEATGLFQKISLQKTTESEAEQVQSVARHLEQHLSTPFAKEESTVTSVTHSRSQSEGFEAVVKKETEIQALVKSLESSSEIEMRFEDALYGRQELLSTEDTFTDLIRESSQTSAREFGSEGVQLCGRVTSFVSSFVATKRIADSELATENLRTAAAKEELAELNQNVQKKSGEETADTILSIHERQQETRRLEVEQEEVNAQFRCTKPTETETICLKDDVSETFSTKPFLEYGQESTDAAGHFERIVCCKPTHAEGEYVHKIPRTLQQNLWTEHVQEELAIAHFEKSRAASVASDAVVKKAVNVDAFGKTVSASTEENLQVSGILARPLQSTEIANVLADHSRESSEKRTREFGDAKAQLIKQVDTVQGCLKASEVLTESWFESKTLSTSAAQEEKLDVLTNIHKKEHLFIVSQVFADSQKSEETREFSDRREVADVGFANTEFKEVLPTTIAVKEYEEVQSQPFVEYGIEDSDLVAEFSKIAVEKTSEGETTAARGIPRIVQQNLSTSHASIEDKTAEIEKLRSESTDSTTATKWIVPTETSEKLLKAATSEDQTVAKNLSRDAEKGQVVETLEGKATDASGIRCLESTNKSSNFDKNLSIVLNRSHTSVVYPAKVLKTHQIFTRSAAEESLDVEQSLALQEKHGLVEKVTVDQQKSDESRSFKIEQTSAGTSLLKAGEDLLSAMKLRDALACSGPALKTHEFLQTTADSIAHFGRIAAEKDDRLGVEKVMKLPREWQECLNTKAAGEERNSQNYDFSRSPALSQTCKLVKWFNRGDSDLLQTKSSTEEAAHSTPSLVFDSSKLVAKIETILNEKPINSAGIKLKETSAELGSLSAEWKVVLNDLEAELNLMEPQKEMQALKTRASSDVSHLVDASISFHSQKNSLEEKFLLHRKENATREFKISRGEVTKTMQRESDSFQISSKAKTDRREEPVWKRLLETSSEEAKAGVLLVRRSVGRTSVSADRAVSVNAVLSQTLNTIHASDISQSESVEWVGREQMSSSAKTFKARNKDEMAATLKASEERSLEADLTVESKKTSASECDAKIVAGNAESDRRTLKESSTDAYDCLTQWTTVFQDLEAHVKLASSLNLFDRLTTVESTTESAEITENWTRNDDECLMPITLCEPLAETCENKFGIASEELVQHIQKQGLHAEQVSRTMKAFNKESQTLKTKESGLVKLNAMVTLHRISSSLPQRLNELILNDTFTISAEPLTLRTDAAETDSASVQFTLVKPTETGRDQLQRVHYNTTDGIELETLQAGDEKVKMLVDLQGKSYERGLAQTEWRLPNDIEPMVLDTEEAGDNQAVLYAQLTSKHDVEREATTVESIPRRHEPLSMLTEGSTEENRTVSESWVIPLPAERKELVRNIPNVGENVSQTTLESEEHFVSVGLYYETPAAVETTSLVRADRRNLGEYQLNTKAASTEDKILSFSLSRKQHSELLKTKWITNFKSTIDLRVLESSVEDTAGVFHLNRPASTEHVGTVRFCPHVGEPFMAKCHECSSFEETIYCCYSRRNQQDSVISVQNVANFGGISSLSTDAAEESVLTFTPELKRFNEFNEFAKTFIVCNTSEPLELCSLASSSESTAISTNLNCPESSAKESMKLKCANRGTDIVEKLKESSEIKETSYLSYEKGAQKERLDYVVSQSNYGGHVKLNTDASEESESNSAKTLVSDRLCVASCSKTSVQEVTSSVSFSVKASSEMAATVGLSYSQAPAFESSKKVLTHNNSEAISALFIESCENVENISYELKRLNEEERLEKTLPILSKAAPLILTTSAVSQEDFTKEIMAKKDRVEEMFAELRRVVANTAEPISLSTLACSDKAAAATYSLSRSSQTEHASLTRICANTMEPLKFRLTETTELSETSNYQFRQESQQAECSVSIKEARFGGGAILSTSSTKEVSYATNYDLNPGRLSEAYSVIVRWIANTSEPVELFSECSKEQKMHSVCLFEKGIQTESTAILVHIPNQDSFRTQISESTSIVETTNLQFRRAEEHLEGEIFIKLACDGGHLSLHSFASVTEEYTLHSELSSKAARSAEALLTMKTCCTSENPSLHTSCSKDEFFSSEASFSRPSASESTECVTRTPHRGTPHEFSLTESMHVDETSTCQLSRADNRSDISEVLNEAQFGGAFSLSTKATQYNSADVSLTMEKNCLYDLTTDIVIIEKRSTEPLILATSYSQEASVSCTSMMQRSSHVGSAQVLRHTPRQVENYAIRISESKEINEINNISLMRHEAAQSQAITIREARIGGHLILYSKRSVENYVDVEPRLSKAKSTAESSLVLKIPNEEIPFTLICSHSSTEESILNSNLSKADSSHEAIIRLMTAHSGGSTELSSSSSREITVNVSTYLEKEARKSFESETTLAISRYGGGDRLMCSAASEKSGEINVKLSRSEATESNVRIEKISRDETFEFYTSASQENSVYSNHLIAKKTMAPEGVSLSIRTPLQGEHVEFASRASEQVIFNADCDYTKQPTEFVLHWTSYEARTEPSINMNTRACQEESVELAETDVRRRLVVYTTESVIERAHREISPVVLYSEQAEETIIRTDEHLESSEWRHVDVASTVRTDIIREEEQMVCEASSEVARREEHLLEQTAKSASEKRVSFAAEVTEKTMSLDMDMSMTVERKEAPSIVKKPMKIERERRGRRGELKRNEAPNFVPVRRNSLLMALNIGSPHNIPHFKTLQDIVKAIKEAGLEYSNLIFGIDYTRSNYYQGEKTFDGRSLHSLDSEEPNPYQQVIEIVGKTLSSFDADGIIPVYGFGSEECTDQTIFNLADARDHDACCNGFEEVLRVYNEKTPSIPMSGPTNFVPLIEKAIDICREKHSYHILVIVADGQVTNEKINQKAIAAASHYPLSIIMVGVGDGPWNMMNRFDETLPKRIFDNFHFVDFHKVMFNAPNQEASFALNALMEIPDQYKAIKELGLLKHSRRG